MSAFIVSSEIMTQIRDALINKSSKDADEVTEMVMAWAKMNRYAVNCRYGERKKVSVTLKPLYTDEKIISIFQLLKYLHCLSYQCSEGDTDKKHKIACQSLSQTIAYISYQIISETKEYNEAQWG